MLSTLSLALLAPDIVHAIIDGKLPRGPGITAMTELPVGLVVDAVSGERVSERIHGRTGKQQKDRGRTDRGMRFFVRIAVRLHMFTGAFLVMRNREFGSQNREFAA